jgi:hypothetical protein
MVIKSWREVGPEVKFFGGSGVIVPMGFRKGTAETAIGDEEAIRALEGRVGVRVADADPMRGAAAILERALIDKLGGVVQASRDGINPSEPSNNGSDGGEA